MLKESDIHISLNDLLEVLTAQVEVMVSLDRKIQRGEQEIPGLELLTTLGSVVKKRTGN
jgi:hypothetical protein